MAGKKKVFISYKRNVEPDEPIALEIFSRLSKKCDVFIDLKMMVGTKWSKEIEENLMEADFFISLISANSIKSDMVSTEIQMAYKHARMNGKPVILPVRLNYFEDLGYDLTAYLDSSNYLAWRSHADTPLIIQELRRAIRGDTVSDRKVLDIKKQRAKDKEATIRRLLYDRDHRQARAECERFLEHNSDAYTFHLLLAIAILIGEGLGPYAPRSVRLVEKHLEKACEEEGTKATAFVIWGIIKHDYYLLNGLPQGNPSLNAIKKLLEETNPDLVDIRLLDLISIDRITYKALGLQRFFVINS